MRPADTAAGTDALVAVQPAASRARTLARVTLITISAAVLLGAVAVLAYTLAAARVPEQRATLENLVHAETGLDVRFADLRLRWGWYGPEAVFHSVELREPGEARPLLTAPELVLGVDLWRMLRSGDLAISRIRVVDPDIDVTRASPGRAARASAGAAPMSPARLLTRWRGTRIQVLGGRVRGDFSGVPLTAGIRRIELRRAGTEWSADAQLTLPQPLGTTAEAALRLHGEAAHAADLSGTLTLSSRQLQLAGWRELLKSAPGARYLPSAGSADLTLELDLAQGGVVRSQGTLAGAALEWPAVESGPGLALDELRANWHLERSAAGWHLAVEPLELGAGSRSTSLSVDAATDGSWVSGRLQRAPVAVLAGLARGVMPQLRLSGVELAGTVREGSFDWGAARPADARLRTTVELDDLSLTPRGRAFTLAGLTAHVSGTGANLDAALDAGSARLTLAADPRFALGSIGVRGQLALVDNGRTWRVSTRALEVRHDDAHLSLSGALTGEDSGAHPRVDVLATFGGAPVELVRAALGAPGLAALGTAAGELTGGRIERAQLAARGPLDEPLPWSGARRTFTGSLELTGASLTGSPDWPDLRGLHAHLDWRGARVRARVDGAVAGGFRITAARAEWNARDASLTRLAGRLAGDAGVALAWLRAHPRLEGYAPGIDDLALSGDTVLDFELRRAPRSAAAGTQAIATRLTALLDGAQLRPVAGLPGIQSLRGTLAFADGHLQRSTLTGQWLGGPITVGVGERRERGATAVVITGKGMLDVEDAVAAATGVHSDQSPLQGNTEWSAELALPSASAGGGNWRVRADASLAGVASGLPEPFAKAPATVLPLHIELSGSERAGELRLALGERLRAVAAVSRRGDLWRIERGAVNLAAGAPTLPTAPVVEIEGTLGRLDLPAYALLWRQLARKPALPALRVGLTVAELRVGSQSLKDVRVAADVGLAAGRLKLESTDLDALVRWDAVVDASHPASVHAERLDLARLTANGTAPALAAALGSDTQLSIGDLRWRGRSLGRLTATLATRAGALEASDLHLTGAGDEVRGALSCGDGACRASFSLDTHDAAATLARLGFRADLAAARGLASGELTWPTVGAAALEAVRGQLHVELDDGLTRSAPPDEAPGSSLGLLAVPGLIAGMGLPQMPFTRLTADYAVADGQAVTSDLHVDGDTEILMRGRIGLIARDYDAQVWVLKGEERLPAAVRRLGPGARVAALWMSLRELFAATNHERATLRLRGTWDDPMVAASE